MRDRSGVDILGRLRKLAGGVNAGGHEEPDLHVFEAAADEIERLRNQLGRISSLAHAAADRPKSSRKA